MCLPQVSMMKSILSLSQKGPGFKRPERRQVMAHARNISRVYPIVIDTVETFIIVDMISL